jgi:hypothetical protein
MDQRLTNQEVWIATLVFIGMDVLSLPPLPFMLRKISAPDLLQPIFFLFWGWDLYYRFFYPKWIRWFAPLDIPLYGAIGVGMWWLASRLPGPIILWFVLLGGMEGIVEHILGIYGFRILRKVPWLKDVSPAPALVFSFFEYVFYWTLVAWLAFGFSKLLERLSL